MPNILAIETSCDETAVAIITGDDRPLVLVNEVSSQIPLHQLTGGVVPEVAAREQAVAMLPVLEHALAQAPSITKETIDLIAYTQEPGLIGSLLVGIETAQTLAALWGKTTLPLHHVRSHIYAAMAGLAPDEVKFPAVVLVVSGGHTQLWLMKKHLEFELLGQTRDDAAGEAFDKIARLLGLPYPGGPSISQEAAKLADLPADLEGPADPTFMPLPRPMLDDPSSDFSFSGLKTAVLYRLRDEALTDELRTRLAADAQQAIVDVLVAKTIRAAKHNEAKTVILAGGVAANATLRKALSDAAAADEREFLRPSLSLCTDNAAMVGIHAWYSATLAH